MDTAHGGPESRRKKVRLVTIELRLIAVAATAKQQAHQQAQDENNANRLPGIFLDDFRCILTNLLEGMPIEIERRLFHAASHSVRLTNDLIVTALERLAANALSSSKELIGGGLFDCIGTFAHGTA